VVAAKLPAAQFGRSDCWSPKVLAAQLLHWLEPDKETGGAGRQSWQVV
jgi:hypothetical protein